MLVDPTLWNGFGPVCANCTTLFGVWFAPKEGNVVKRQTCREASKIKSIYLKRRIYAGG